MEKAVNIAEKLAKIKPQENNIELAQCYCEYSQSLEPESAVEKRSVLQRLCRFLRLVFALLYCLQI